jgi:hypothetical protein
VLKNGGGGLHRCILGESDIQWECSIVGYTTFGRDRQQPPRAREAEIHFPPLHSSSSWLEVISTKQKNSPSACTCLEVSATHVVLLE